MRESKICWVALICCVLTGTAKAQKPVPRFEAIDESADFPIKVPSSFSATSGWLVVYENRDKTEKEIRLPVVILHAKTDQGLSPVVYLSGGPGTAGVTVAKYPGAYPWITNRDFIALGQRGTQYAKPALLCEEFTRAIAEDTDTLAAATACRERLTSAGVDLNQYNSDVSADDLSDLREVLGISTWNLYAVSYGTRLALTYSRRFSDSVDTMILDSPLPPNAIYDDESTANRKLVFERIAADCAHRDDCNRAFPELADRFFDSILRATKSPITSDLSDKPITGADLVATIPMSSRRHLQYAPLYMDAAARRDPKLLEMINSPAKPSDLAWGMRFSVWCSEALPFSERAKSDGPGNELGGFDSAAIDPAICQAWGVEPLERTVTDPVRASTPTLIFAGALDPMTPPQWATLAGETLDNSLIVIVENESHSSTQQWGGSGCAMRLANDFLGSFETMLEKSNGETPSCQEGPIDYLLEF